MSGFAPLGVLFFAAGIIALVFFYFEILVNTDICTA